MRARLALRGVLNLFDLSALGRGSNALTCLSFRCCRREDRLVAGGGPPRPATGGFRLPVVSDRIRRPRLGSMEGPARRAGRPLVSSPSFDMIGSGQQREGSPAGGLRVC